MMRGTFIAVVVACLLAATPLSGQSAPDAAQNPDKPAGGQTPPAGSTSNPFPDDTSNVPVMPSKGAPPLPEGTYSGDAPSEARLPAADTDPVRSPDDPATEATDTGNSSSSLSDINLNELMPGPDTGKPEKKGKHVPKEPTHQEAAKSDIDVGQFYLDQKDWRGALSRFESALVLDPENPEVYWGLAESERHMGQYAKARQHYQTLLDYDPDGKHAKQARKALQDPAFVAAQKPEHGKDSTTSPQ
jgi:hypothetical protein